MHQPEAAAEAEGVAGNEGVWYSGDIPRFGAGSDRNPPDKKNDDTPLQHNI
ncbi:MAG: hypothetical protein LBD24_05790 [Spirochaetaceae bacterium]|nr:hypothetical protein [Spirochaetaceae bacterium]